MPPDTINLMPASTDISKNFTWLLGTMIKNPLHGLGVVPISMCTSSCPASSSASLKLSLVMKPMDQIPFEGYSTITTFLNAGLSLEKIKLMICLMDGYTWRTPGSFKNNFSMKGINLLLSKCETTNPVAKIIKITRIKPRPGIENQTWRLNSY